MGRRYAISDIHGCNQSFGALLDRLSLSTADELYLLGDYIDRGPDSKGVVDRILQLQRDGYQVVSLIGNHEEMMMEAYADEQAYRMWMLNGARETLQSYHHNGKTEFPPDHVKFYYSLKLYHEIDGYLMVHAGLNFRYPDPLQDRQAIIWVRNWYDEINYDWLGDRIILHGHTPTPRLIIEHQAQQLDQLRALVIDAGCKFNEHVGLGYLCAFDLDERRLIFQENVESS